MFDTLMFIPEIILQKSWSWKKSAEDKCMKNYPVGKEFTQWLLIY